MGKALHRKKSVPLARGTRTHGIGIKYSNPAPFVRALSSEQAAERDRLKALTKPTRGVRDWNIHCLMTLAGFALDAWEDSILEQKSLTKDPSTERVVDKALTAVNTAVTKHCDTSGIDVDRLIQSLRRSRQSAEMTAPLALVCKKFLLMFEKIVNNPIEAPDHEERRELQMAHQRKLEMALIAVK